MPHAIPEAVTLEKFCRHRAPCWAPEARYLIDSGQLLPLGKDSAGNLLFDSSKLLTAAGALADRRPAGPGVLVNHTASRKT